MSLMSLNQIKSCSERGFWCVGLMMISSGVRAEQVSMSGRQWNRTGNHHSLLFDIKLCLQWWLQMASRGEEKFPNQPQGVSVSALQVCPLPLLLGLIRAHTVQLQAGQWVRSLILPAPWLVMWSDMANEAGQREGKHDTWWSVRGLWARHRLNESKTCRAPPADRHYVHFYNKFTLN